MHPTIRPYLEYFSLPSGYGPPGLRWSHDGEALETDDSTWRFTRQIADFLDGFAAVRPVAHFAHVIECFALLSMTPPPACPDPERFKLVASTFRRLNGPARNAGALFGQLCASIPPAACVPPGGGKSLAHWLTHSPSLGFLYPTGPGNPEIPSLAAHTFRERVASRLRMMTDFEVRHWLRHGVGPDDRPGEPIAEELGRKPPTLAEFLEAAVKDRSRLGGAVPLVRHFVSALTLPPRKRIPPKLPVGGYADVTNRGDPSHLLPSQLALDPDEFVRRFAENELLFFRREDPHERRQEHLALVVDQGVLTWGTVRLALGAAVLAFLRLAGRRKLAVTVRFGSAPGERFAPPAGDAERFGEALEASDLSPHPAHALAEEVLDPSAPLRDIVLLTHPRTLKEAEVRRLAKLLAKGCRLFALSATEDGRIELAHLRDGGPVPVNRFRVDFTPPPVPKPIASPVALYVPWSGDVEPVPFPFRLGLTGRIADLAFDAAGEHLFAATVTGILHAWTVDGGSVEVLPRGMLEGAALRGVQAVLGVSSGFAVCGQFRDGLAVVHYDWPTRIATLHPVLVDGGDLETAWHAFPDLHSVAVKAGPVYRAIDLGTGGLYPDPRHPTELVSRAKTALERARNLVHPPPSLPVLRADHSQTPPPPYLVVDPDLGQVRVQLENRRTIFTPTMDGRLKYAGVELRTAQLAADTLALLAPSGRWNLFDVDDDGRALADYPAARFGVAKLSPDGRRFVRHTGRGELTVTEPAGRGTLLVTRPARCHSDLVVRLGYRCLGVSAGERGCLLSWDAGPLVIRDGLTAATDFGQRARNRMYTAPAGGRFVAVHQFNRWEVGMDALGQIAFLREGRVACLFLYRRGRLSAWSPAGVRFGPPEVTGGPDTPAALEQLGEILRAATR
jgi:hypothetical protein